jgi:ABC-type oligopeptide transport system ATPase subunit
MQLAELAPATSARARAELQVKDLKTYFPTEAALVRAVNSVTFTAARAK